MKELAKVLIIGVNARAYKDKQTGNMHNMITLCCVKNNVNFEGKAIEEVIAGDTTPLYKSILNGVNGDISSLVNRYANIDRDNRGYVENYELLEKSKDEPVVWGF
ncbi:MAG TPA: hypothetical protein PLY69_08585 [Bacteroidales bacterium]|nr:hypothetical protein [Bacteroidales bacterium]